MTIRTISLIFVLIGIQYLAVGQNELNLGSTTVRVGELKSEVLSKLKMDRAYFHVQDYNETKQLEMCIVNVDSMLFESRDLGRIFFNKGRVVSVQRHVGNYHERTSLEFAKALTALLDNPATQKGKLVTIRTESTKFVGERGMRNDEDQVSIYLSQNYRVWYTVGESIDSSGEANPILSIWDEAY